jgi:hypothetical protein
MEHSKIYCSEVTPALAPRCLERYYLGLFDTMRSLQYIFRPSDLFDFKWLLVTWDDRFDRASELGCCILDNLGGWADEDGTPADVSPVPIPHALIIWCFASAGEKLRNRLSH